MHRLTCLLLLAVPFVNTAGAQPMVTSQKLVVSDSNDFRSPAQSPDNRWLIYVQTVSSTQNKVMIRSLAGGASRELLAGKGEQFQLRFTPQGDRVVFTSTTPRRGADDPNFYLVSAPFDTRTGTFSAPMRPVTLEPIRREGRLRPAISPDGKMVAYVACCGDANLRVVPVIGGNARTLVTSKASGTMIPGWLGWSADGRSVLHHQRGPDDVSVISRVSVASGESTVLSRFRGGFGVRTPDGKYFLVYARNLPNGPVVMRVMSMEGKALGEVRLPMRADFSFSTDGLRLLGREDNTKAVLSVVPTAGGAVRRIGRGESYEWPEGWSPDGARLYYTYEEGQEPSLRLAALDGNGSTRVARKVGRSELGVIGNQLIELVQRPASNQLTLRVADVVSRDLSSGKETTLMTDVVDATVCCSVIPPGGMYYGITGQEFYVRQMRGDRQQVRGARVDGTSRLIVDVPRSAGITSFAVHGTRAAYVEQGKDSTRIKVSTAANGRAATIASYPSNTRVGEIAWSHDGRLLSMYLVDAPKRLNVFRFSDAGGVQGAPLTLSLPFDYFYETFWLPDGSGMSMIAQPTGGTTAEIAIVKLADPSNPIYPAKADPISKWGHALSPDGKLISYPSEKSGGSVIHSVELSDLLRTAGVPR